MPHVIYSAKTPDGRDKTGFIEADTASAAVEKLRAEGLTDIALHSSPAIAQKRSHVDFSDRAKADRMAAMELRFRGRSDLRTFLTEWFRFNRAGLLIIAATFAFAAFRRDAVLAGITVLLAAGSLALSLWRRRTVTSYQDLLKAYSLGDWARVRRIIPLLKKSKKEILVFDLAAREACLQVVAGDLDGAIAGLRKWQTQKPVEFHSRCASCYHLHGNYAAFVREIEAACAMRPEDPLMQLDVALANARLGSRERAAEFLEKIDYALLPVPMRPSHEYVLGLMALEQDNEAARQHLETAFAAMQERAGSAATWIITAFCGGALALARIRAGDKTGAQTVLDKVAPVLRVHGDTPLLQKLQAAGLGIERRK